MQRKRKMKQLLMEMMALDREIRDYYAQIKHHFIYNFDEPGMWDEFSERLTRLRKEREDKANEARKAATEAKLALSAQAARKKRARQKTLSYVYNTLGGIVVIAIIVGFGLAMRWMFNQQGAL
jgi:hypothetical protein